MISLEWVKDYIDIRDQDLEELAVKVTQAGINVEKVISNEIKNLIIGQVLSCVDHPDSDHLHVCSVDVGEGKILQIVCGAPNVREGLKVIVALPGAILPGNIEIKKSKIRGVESNGMLCALFELGLEEKNDLNYAKGICELDDSTTIGGDPLTELGFGDTLYELDVHKHRNNDCYYHIGFAYEIAAILNRKVHLPDTSYQEIKDSITNHFQLKVETDKCPYYLAKMVTDVQIGESPNFIKRRLTAADMRPINNVVDISNYVMLEFGQPLHFFDKDKLGDQIVVRDAIEKEQIVTLDGKMRQLRSSDIVITDSSKPVCIAGVMGGENTEVSEDTHTILIESAIFDAVRIRYTAANLELKSEASIRYGKGLSYEYTKMAMDRACHLLEKYAHAKVLTGIVCHDKIDKKPKIVSFVPEEVNKILGITIDEEDMKTELARLDFSYTLKDGVFEVSIPNRRLDIDPNVNDIAEEIGRLYGYHNLVSTLPVVPLRRGKYVGDVAYRKALSKRMRLLRLNEVKTYTLVSPELASQFQYRNRKNVILPNPMSSDKSIVRTTLLPSLLQVYQYNKARKVEDILLYEISKTYDQTYHEESLISGLLYGNYLTDGWNKSLKVDFYVAKGIVEDIFNYMGFANRYHFQVLNDSSFHPGMSAKVFLDHEEVGVVGRIHPKICKDEVYVFELSLNSLMKKTTQLKFKEANKYPGMEKDMAFIVSRDTLAGEIISTIQKTGGKILDHVSVFDVYTGENVPIDKKSIAFKLYFSDPKKTLTEEEVMKIFYQIVDRVEKNYHAVLRDK